ncbi:MULTISPECIES: ABC transporter permease [unclassified Streptococcus]|uniref:ABC transporter permease n=1 Tax=unclassified Streptococcus TaxID=2608887 RepID=UPI0010723BB1|nr:MULTISPECIES: ABC transporter permease [unclassified Streptococcus]MBF0786445.1 ABC transporter permease [Streptococcus sp. 19428wC2_LYSM12]MCQ9212553.1 ABC transporter permease [Streptococcus sp. B01]MCQ9213892.1 ABC transporter permease [Streptococcus sp. O1]TFV06852.1 ABC transporter permease [Streptococcus sp. LYSM12]
MFYLKLAYGNIRKSPQTFAPFILASLVLFVLNCSTLLLIFSPVTQSMKTGALALGLGTVVLTIFSVIMEIYSFNFLMKQRAREFGLYNMLGMNKKQLAFVATLELVMVFGLVVLLGSILSASFSNVLYLIFVNLVQGTDLHFEISFVAFISNIVIFAGIFFLLELLAIHKVGFSSPLILFRSKEEGEREPKGNIVLAISGLICLSIGYYLSISSSQISAVVVLYRFFIAVLFVIIGTYLFYISFMAWYLKFRRKQKKYFYTPEHFISTSQMIFRMKQHATGLANITLLAVMTFVTIATTTSLYSNTINVLDKLYPKQSSIELFVDNRAEGDTYLQDKILDQYPSQKGKQLTYFTLTNTIEYDNSETLHISKESIQHPRVELFYSAYFITQDDFRHLGNTLPELKENQIAFFSPNSHSDLKQLILEDRIFENVSEIKNAHFPDILNTYNPILIVVNNESVLQEFKNVFARYSTNGSENFFRYRAFLDLTDAEAKSLGQEAGDVIELAHQNGEAVGTILQKSTFSNLMLGFVSGFLFTGFLLGISFLLGAALIIYYKQYSEGHEDKKSYKILQEVGMSQDAVKKTINSQILLVFFMPLAMAILHFIVSLVMLKQMLSMFGVTSHAIIYTVSGITIAIICIIYFSIYKWTSRTYYRIIER